MTTTQILGKLPTNELPRGTVDFITGTVEDLKGNQLTMTVELAVTPLTPAGTAETAHSWLAASWLGTASSERQCQTTSVVDTSLLTEGPDGIGTEYGVFVRLDNSPAHPIFLIGRIVLI